LKFVGVDALIRLLDDDSARARAALAAAPHAFPKLGVID
jgi:riboflavin kinase/FMN adenylyltransferase